MRGYVGWLSGVFSLAAFVAGEALANVNLEWRPLGQTATHGQTVTIGLYAVSDSAASQSVGYVDIVLNWDPARLVLLGKTDNGPYAWFTSNFPNDSNLDGLNAPYTGPSPFVPANDGNAFYQSSRAFPPSPPAYATPQGLLITTFRFRVEASCGSSDLMVMPSGGPSTQTRLLSGTVPGLVVTGTIGPPAWADIACDDGVFCNGVESCINNACTPGIPPCNGSVPYCVESTNTCVACLGDAQCSDSQFCNGAEHCLSNNCVAGDDPCPGQFCDEGFDRCFDCLTSADCDDGIDCTIDACSLGFCLHGPDHAACDDGVFCNGGEVCDKDVGCVTSGNPCHDPASCDEFLDRCGDCPAPTVMAAGARYLSITPTLGTPPVLILITGHPTEEDVACLSKFVQANGALGSAPVYETPENWAAVNVFGTEILPRTTYRVCTSCESGGLSANAEVTTRRYGDADNDGIVTLDDLLCVLDGFTGVFICSLTEVDFMGPGCKPDQHITLDDILAVIGAFQGQQTVPASCPNSCVQP